MDVEKWRIESLNAGEWSTECFCDDYQDAEEQLKSYLANVTERPVRLIGEGLENGKKVMIQVEPV